MAKRDVNVAEQPLNLRHAAYGDHANVVAKLLIHIATHDNLGQAEKEFEEMKSAIDRKKTKGGVSRRKERC